MQRLATAVIYNVPFWILTIVMLALLITSFFMPPEGKIDESVLKAVAELMGLFALWSVVYALKTGTKTTVKHNGTEVSIDGDGE